MTLSRRSFMHALGLGAASAAVLREIPVFAARGREALAGLPPFEREALLATRPDARAIRINSNENPVGPGERTLAAITAALTSANRYPFADEPAARAAIARAHGVAENHVLLGCGSTEVLRMAVQACVSPSRHLVTGRPTFEEPGTFAHAAGGRVAAVPVDRDLRLDLDAMASAASGAGLVYLCNPNNPTATVHGATAVTDFVARVNRTSPRTTILIDEAYHEYVDAPGYKSMVPLAVENPRVIVTRTFSKVFGMAGLRIGYAIGQPATLQALAPFRLEMAVNVFAAAGAMAALADSAHLAAEQARNRQVRASTREAFSKMGLRVADSQANFLMVDVGRNVQQVIDGCRRDGVLIGRPFPPLTTWARISIGTADEMTRATGVLARVLEAPPVG